MHAFTTVYPYTGILQNEVIIIPPDKWEITEKFLPDKDFADTEPDDFILDGKIVPTQKVMSCWDTGAGSTCMPEDILKKAGAVLIDLECEVGIADGSKKLVPRYLAHLLLQGNIIIENVAIIALDSCLIGMNVINKGDFATTSMRSPTGELLTMFSFECPSRHDFNFAEQVTQKNLDTANKHNANARNKRKRNNKKHR